MVLVTLHMEQEESKGRLTRVHVPNRLWELLEEVAVVMDAPGPRWCLQTLLRRLENLALTGEVGVFGFEFDQALKRLNNRGRLFDDTTPGVPGVDPIKLHRSPRAKSGFVGVYSNGKGFRAEGKDPKNPISVVTIGTFPTAEGAAWARYRHYKQHGLAYGQLEEAVNKLREEEAYRTMSEDQLKHNAIWDAANLLKKPLEDLTPEERALEHVDPLLGGRR